ncbi:MAG: hypothetical protein V9E88_14390 [Ferruginibacter sp.]
MKKTLLMLGLVTGGFLVSCSKDDEPVNNNNKVVRVEFSSDTLSMYNFALRLDTTAVYDSANTVSFQQNYVFNNLPNSTGDTLKFTVYPPFSWVGTTAEANITLRLLIDGVLKSTNSGLITGADRPGGLTIYTVL